MKGAKDIITAVVALTLICIVVTAALAVTNHFTVDAIAAVNERLLNESLTEIVPSAASFDELTETDLPESPDNYESAYLAVDSSSQSIGLVVITKIAGYGGDIRVMTGIADGQITGVKILAADNETPGLGARISESDYLAQYKDKPAGRLSLSRDGGDVDAVTGATISSRALLNAVNSAVETYEVVKDVGIL